MNQHDDNILRQILQKLEALEDHLHDLEERLESVESSPSATPPPAIPPQQPSAPSIPPAPAPATLTEYAEPATPPLPPSPPAPFSPYDTPVTLDLDRQNPSTEPSALPDEKLSAPGHKPFDPYNTPVTLDLNHDAPVEEVPPASALAPVSPAQSGADEPVAHNVPAQGAAFVDQKLEQLRQKLAARSSSPGAKPQSYTTPPAPADQNDPEVRFRQAIAGLRPGAVPSKPKESWEVRIATTWLPRIGLFFLALVCLLFAREYTQGPLGKIIATYAASFALIGVGLWKEKKYPHWARPVMAGGLAFSYFASYAMGFVEPMRLLDSLTLKLIILGINLVIIFGVAHWKKSEVIGGTALILGYLTTGVVGHDVAAFSSSLALSVAALLFLWLNKWYAATALACAATYLAHFYVWRFVPEAEVRTPPEAFWHHFLFLSLYFTVFTAAALTGKSAARDEDTAIDGRGMFSRPVQSFTRHNILTALAQANVAAYVIGMVTLLKLTGIYWDQAWLFLLPMAAAFAGLGLLFIGFATIQMTHLVAATLCLTLGLIAAISPMWLPVFLSLQAIGMITAARGRYAELWRDLSFIIIGYACAYVVTGSAADVLQLSSTETVNFPWWTHAVVTVIALAYAVIWEWRFHALTSGLAPAGHFLVAFIAIFVWRVAIHDLPAGQAFLYHISAIPVVALAAVFARAQSLSTFIFGTILLALVNWSGFGAVSRGETDNQYWAAAIALAGLASGLVVEKRGTGDRSLDRWLWRAIYAWSQLLLGFAIYWLCGKETEAAVLTAVFAATIAAAWLLRSAAFGKSAFIVAVFIVGSTGYRDPILIPLAVVVAAAGYPIGLSSWTARTGDTSPWINRWGQAVVVAVSLEMVLMSTSALDWNGTFTLGAFALFAALYAASGRFTPVISVVCACAVGMFVLLSSQLGGDLRYYSEEGPAIAAPIYSLLGVFLLVAAERALAFAPRINLKRVSQPNRWLLPNNQALLTNALALATLVMAVMAIRILPDLRLFYFTGAMVAVAFIWIVFGFWFQESAYRKVGFILLCIGIVKGLIWDVLSLKQTLYRIVSWSILGLLAIAASFLYTRFKTQLTYHDEQ